MSSPQKPSLPSIKEMFPEYLMNVPPHMRVPPPSPMMSPAFHTQLSRSNPIPDQNRPRPLSSSSSPARYRRHSSPRVPPPPPATRGFYATHPDRDTRRHAQEGQEKPYLPAHSFDVLRSVPSSSSLQHINSSPTYSTRNGSSSSAPTFQVTVAPQDPHHRAPTRGSRHEQAEAREAPAASTSTSRALGYPTIISFPVSGSSSQRELSPDDGSGTSDDGELSGPNSGKKHVCTTCFKRFNRPSSLRIHLNTHTGATPFRCPYPNCGREFNVNSNMRRHYRNHNTPGFASSNSHDARRRRRRRRPASWEGPSSSPVSPATHMSIHRHGGAAGGDSTSPTTGPIPLRVLAEQRYVASPPISTLSVSEDSDDDMSDPIDGTYAHVYARGEEEGQDDSDYSYEFEPQCAVAYTSEYHEEFLSRHPRHHQHHQFHQAPQALGHPEHEGTDHHQLYPLPQSLSQAQSHLASQPHPCAPHHAPSGPPSPPSQSSSSPSPPLPPPPPPNPEPVYSPSAPYLRSLDSRVSTALRPAFTSHPHPPPHSPPHVKQEPMLHV